MRFFWILIIGTIASIVFYFISFAGLELVISLMIIDFIALIFSEFEGRETGSNSLIKKIENLEKLIYDLFNKLTKTSYDKTQEKKEIEEWLNKF